MQIICNHCGNQLSFPDYQNLVTCDNCGTYLQLKETAVSYTVSIVDEEHFDELLRQNIIINKENKVALCLKELLEIETRHTKISEKTAFFSLLSFRKIEPILLRIPYRLCISILFVLWFDKEAEGLFNLMYILYPTFLSIISLIELFRWLRLYYFEQDYKIKSILIINEIEYILLRENISDGINKWLEDWMGFQNDFTDLKSKYHYQEFNVFTRINIPVGAPSPSKGLRLVVTGSIIGFMSVLFIISSFSATFFIVTVFLVILFILLGLMGVTLFGLGMSVLDKEYEYKKLSKDYFLDRQDLLEELEKYIKIKFG